MTDQPQPHSSPARSFYIVELSVQPGGFRRGELWVAVDFGQVREPLELEFMSGDPESAYLAGCYGETISLWVVQHGRVSEHIDLHSFIQIQVDNHPPIPLSADPASWTESMIRAIAEHYKSDGAQHVVTFVVDWSAIAARLPALAAPALGPGEEAVLQVPDPADPVMQDCEFTILEDGMQLELGRHDLGS